MVHMFKLFPDRKCYRQDCLLHDLCRINFLSCVLDDFQQANNIFCATVQELWSLLEFMMPDIFATGDVDLKKLLNSEDMVLIARIKSILGPFILRRLKLDVMQQLVPKIQEVILVAICLVFKFMTSPLRNLCI